MKKIILLIGLMAACGTAWASASWEKYYQCLEHNGRRMNMGLLPDIPCGDPPKETAWAENIPLDSDGNCIKVIDNDHFTLVDCKDEPKPAKRFVDKPIVTETKNGLIQVEYLHGVNDHVEIMTKETAKDLRDWLSIFLDHNPLQFLDAKPAVR